MQGQARAVADRAEELLGQLVVEALFKAFARALRAAVAIDPTETGVPSTKGTLTA